MYQICQVTTLSRAMIALILTSAFHVSLWANMVIILHINFSQSMKVVPRLHQVVFLLFVELAVV